MTVLSAILGIVLVLGTPAAVVGGITALIVRLVAGSRGRTPAEAGRRAMKGFWMAFVITVAVEIVLVGLCLATIDDIYDV